MLYVQILEHPQSARIAAELVMFALLEGNIAAIKAEYLSRPGTTEQDITTIENHAYEMLLQYQELSPEDHQHFAEEKRKQIATDDELKRLLKN